MSADRSPAPATIVHLSDLHVGPPFQEHVAEQLLEEIAEIRPDLVAISGDLVQDYRREQFEAAARLVERIPPPRVIVPGNHDIPGFNLWERLTRPYELYRQTFGHERESGLYFGRGLAVVGLNSVWPLAPTGGRLSAAELARLAQELGRSPPQDCRILVIHHHLIPSPGFGWHTAMWGARRLVPLLERAGVELVLSGHKHRSYIGSTLNFFGHARRPIIVVQAGTATSRRGRGPERDKNSYNVLRVSSSTIRITHRIYTAEDGRFHRASEHLFPRA